MTDKIKNIIAKLLKADVEEITNISVLKKGMTNRSFLFCYRNERYIIRIPGEGTDKLIDRRQEYEVYQTIKHLDIGDELVYIDADSGYKVSKYWEQARVCDSFCEDDVRDCMQKLRTFHQQKLCVKHEFDIYGQILFYETLWESQSSIYRDYEITKEKVWSLSAYIEKYASPKVLSHMDAIPDNFLLIKNQKGEEEIRLIDWEYAGMQDPHVDLAMFCVYAMYDRCWVDKMIDWYFTEGCEREIRTKIYCYIAVCGLLWSNWCEYKRQLGIEFGKYALAQYRFAKEYYQIARESMINNEPG